jgi:hypothetical protein
MSFVNWKEAVFHLREVIGPPTPEQRELASQVGLRLSDRHPRVVAAALLRRAFRKPLSLKTGVITASQDEFLEELAREFRRRCPECESSDEASAWIQYFLVKRRLQSLKKLRLKKGDLVAVTSSGKRGVEEVASIGLDGRVYFKGGRAKSWPDRLKLLATAEDKSKRAEDLRREASNRAALRAPSGQWSDAKHAELAAYHTPDNVTLAEIDQLESIIDRATDESPIRTFLETHTHVLASLVGGPERFCIPGVSLGRKYVADFFLADVDSLGIRWILIELESPRSRVTLEKSNQFDKSARKGISQVQEWREWLQNNLDQARRRTAEDGLGLFDIRPLTEGLVFVGRRQNLRLSSKALRLQLWEQDRIQMHSYDWLLEQLRGVLTYSGPSGLNRYLLHRSDNEEFEQAAKLRGRAVTFEDH